MKLLLCTAVFICCFFTSAANIRLPHIFGSNMVLQRGKPIPVWGWAAPGESVEIRFHGQAKKTKADKSGNWQITLAAEAAGGPYELAATGKNNITLTNVLVGEVWVCSGQSNMEMNVASSMNAAAEIAGAAYPMIRHVKVPVVTTNTPATDIGTAIWEEANAATVGQFTAVGYFFARRVFKEINVPVGIINASRGGSIVETWISKEALRQSAPFKDIVKDMPYEKVEATYNGLFQKRMQEFGLQEAGAAANDPAKYALPATDESGWKTMLLPGDFNSNGLQNFDGDVWFRKELMLDKADVAKAGVLHLSTIDDMDETFINGKKIGGSNTYDVVRTYPVPAGVFKEGKNIIAIHVTDNHGNGGVFGKPYDMRLMLGGQMMPLAGEWKYKMTAVKKELFNPNAYPSLLFNGMMHPLMPLAIRGVLWYQGESNAGRSYQYRQAFPLLIADWRQRFGQGDFPFYFVQLASFDTNPNGTEKSSDWAELREAQTKTLAVPNTGMAVAFDVGETADIHPKDKQTVGERLAAIALANQYGKKSEWSGPVFASMSMEGSKAILSFLHSDSGFVVKDKYNYIKGFTIAGADQKFHFAQAAVRDGKVVVWSDAVAAPVAVRYAWANDMPEANLYNRQGFPAVPFRTDAWPGITDAEKYVVTDYQ